MGEELSLNHDSPAVQKHLEITQNVITRMAEKPEYSLIALIPAVLFLILDTYYLALERGFRESYNAFVRKLSGDEPMLADLYKVAPSGSVAGHFGASLKSFSIWTFYVTLVVMVLFVWWMLGR